MITQDDEAQNLGDKARLIWQVHKLGYEHGAIGYPDIAPVSHRVIQIRIDKLADFIQSDRQTQAAKLKERVLSQKFTIVSPETESEAMEVVPLSAINKAFEKETL